ncbi:uncharacterized protein LOC119674051 [Teleopsis dalmanni]|nr:uncharacterized protein LOC119674051 [Teleopsis dalmanni]
MTVKARHETADILKEFNEIVLESNALHKSCEQFGLQVCCFDTDIDLCGMFSMNRSLFFKGEAKIVSYTIVLLQFHLTLGEK